MNSVHLIGRLTKDVELRMTASNTAVVRFTLAVDRRISKADKEAGKQSADFISCIVFGRTAEVLNQYASKGDKIAVDGSISTGSYQNKDGQTVYTTDVMVQNLELLGGARKETEEFAPPKRIDSGDNPSLVIDSDDLPFY